MDPPVARMHLNYISPLVINGALVVVAVSIGVAIYCSQLSLRVACLFGFLVFVMRFVFVLRLWCLRGACLWLAWC